MADPGPPAPRRTGGRRHRCQLCCPRFSWTAGSDATTYGLEVATDPAFSNVVYSVTGLSGLGHSLPTVLAPSTTYHWRLTAANACGGITTGAFSFTTIQIACQTFPSTDVPLPIPEGGGTQGTTTSTRIVGAAAGGTIADVNVLDLAGTHTWMGDLDFYVVSPAATSVQVRERACDSADDFELEYDDQAAPGAPPCPPTGGGTYQPDSPLAAFNGENSAGTWALSVVDNFPEDQGQLDSWGLEICIEVCVDSPLVVANQTIVDPQTRSTCSSITVGPALTVAAAGSLELVAPIIKFVDVVAIAGELSAGKP